MKDFNATIIFGNNIYAKSYAQIYAADDIEVLVSKEFSSRQDFPAVGEKGLLYVDASTGKTYQYINGEYKEFGSGTSAYTITSSSSQTVNGHLVPVITSAQIVGAYNAATTNSSPVIVKHTSTKINYYAQLVDNVNNTHALVLPYYDDMILTYVESNGTVIVDYSEQVNTKDLYNTGTTVIKTEHLPSYVDEIVEGYYYNGQFYEEASHTTVITPSTNKIYYDLDGKLTYRYTGSEYAISSDAAALTALNAFKTEVAANYAQKDGYYESMGVGVADNLAGRADDAVPAEIVFRPSGGTADIADGTATIKSINGNTIVWQQLARPFNADDYGIVNYNSNIAYSEGVASISYKNSLAVDIYDKKLSIVNGHRYYISVNAQHDYPDDMDIVLRSGAFSNIRLGTINDYAKRFSAVVTATSANERVGFQIRLSDTDDIITMSDMCVIDLTKMFGSGNEPSTVEEFEVLFPQPYYAYNAGTLLSLNATAIQSVGFNQWDEEWEAGGIDTSTGQPKEQVNVIRTKNFIPILNSATYYIKQPSAYSLTRRMYVYDANKNFLRYEGTPLGANNTFTFQPGDAFIKFLWEGNAYNNNICINLSHSGYRDGEFEEHWSFTRNLPIANINTDGSITEDATGKTRLFPLGILSTGNVIYDEVTANKAIKRVGVVDLGILTWQYRQASGSYPSCFVSRGMEDSKLSQSRFISDSKYKKVNDPQWFTGGDNIITMHASFYNHNIIIVDSSYTDSATFKAAMSGVMLYYELATPIEVTFAEPLNLSYKVSDFGTEQLLPVNASEPVTTPFKGEIAYGINAVDTLRNLSKNYISKESFTNFTSALGTSLGKTIAMTWNTSTGEYDFTITDNPTTIE